MTKLIKTIVALFLVITSVMITPVLHVEKIEAKENRIPDTTTYYNDFEEVMGNWSVYKGDFQKELNDGKLKLKNKGESIILNDEDALRSSGDLEIKFNYQGTRCFGFVFRADKNDSNKYQTVVHRANENNTSADWSIGQPGGKWNTYINAPILEIGKNYTLIVRYHDTNITILLNGSEVLNEEIIYDNGEGINGDWIGTSGIRKLCVDQVFEIDSYISAPYKSIPNNGFPIINKDMYLSDFTQDETSYVDITGNFDKTVNDNKLTVTNNVQESIMVNKKDKVRNSGDVEMDFTYQEGVRCFGPVFRADDSVKGQWQTVAYQTSQNDDNAVWSVGHPGGYWNTYPAQKLVAGEKYKLVVRYSDSHIQIYLNGQEELNEEIIHESNGPIKDDWSGKIGFRKYCSNQAVTIDRFVSADYGMIPNNGLSNILYMQEEDDTSVDPGEPQENLIYYKQMRNLWKSQKVGTFSDKDLVDEHIVNHIQNLNEDANEYLASITNGATGVWDKLPSDTHSANITTQFKKLNTIARAYATPNTDVYQDADTLGIVLDSLVYLTGERWFDGIKVTGNWWDFQVGIPQELIDILIILYDDIPKELVLKYADIVAQYVPNADRQINGTSQGSYVNISFGVKTSGANRTDLALTYLATGMLLEKQDIMQNIIPSIESVFKTVKKGDGFYEDGSFIQHNDIPYTGSYGNIAIKGVGKILSLLEDTPWQMDEAKIDEFSKLVYDSFVPLVYKGETSPMVGGRSISRAPGARKEGFGSATIYNLLIVANFASEPYKTKLKEAAKYWILKDESNYYYNNNRDLRDLLEVKSVLNDSDIKGVEVPFKGSRMFGSMDRFVHASENYNLGISMYSSRISAFESGNRENKKGWFTSDGMMYIQNEDKQYGEDFWPTVDYYRLPGTTVDTRQLADSLGSFSRQRSPQSFVGGATDGKNSSISMVLNKNGFKNNGAVVGYDLKAFKSWQITEDVIYALGAGINGTSPQTIETIVENRIMDEKMNYKLISNLEFTNNSKIKVSKGDWFMLEANDSKNNIAYVFLDDHNLKLVNETNKGKYQDINEAFINDKTYEETYQKIIIDHGQEAIDDKYAYAVLPGVTKSEVEKFLTSDHQVLYNTKDIQAIKVNGKTLVNIFPTTGGTVEDIAVNGAVSYVVNEDDTSITLNVSDPRQVNSVYDFVFKRDRVEINDNSSQSNALSFTVDTKDKAGSSVEIKIQKYADISELEEEVKKFNEISFDKLTTYSKNIYENIQSEVSHVYENPKITQQEVDSLVLKLKEFISSYDKIIDFNYVNITIEYIDELVEENYTSDSWEVMNNKLEDIMIMIEIYDQNKPLLFDQIELNKKLLGLQELVRKLEVNLPPVEIEVDTTILIELVDLFETLESSKYTEETFEALYKEIVEIKEYIENNQLTQPEVDEYCLKIFKLYEELEKTEINKPEFKPYLLDLNSLEALISKAESLDSDDYSTTDFAKLTNTVEEATALLNKAQKQNEAVLLRVKSFITQDDIDIMVEKLSDVMNNLEKIVPIKPEDKGDIKDESQKNEVDKRENNSPKTSVVQMYGLSMLIMLLSGYCLHKKLYRDFRKKQ